MPKHKSKAKKTEHTVSESDYLDKLACIEGLCKELRQAHEENAGLHEEIALLRARLGKHGGSH